MLSPLLPSWPSRSRFFPQLSWLSADVLEYTPESKFIADYAFGIRNCVG